ncbi:MAG: MMPL family transporter [Kineosporiaceae bacterium]|nr:MMPL family transporter [Kineosporiaceae bacterium]
MKTPLPSPRTAQPSSGARTLDPVPPLRGASGWSLRHRWTTLLGALLIVAGAVVLLTGGLKTTAPAEQLIGDSARAEKIRASADFGDRPIENVVISRPGTPAPVLDEATAAAVATELRAAYRGLKGIAAVADPVLSPDRRVLLLPVALDAAPDTMTEPPAGAVSAQDAVGPMLEATQRVAAAHPELRIGQVGPGSINAEVGEQLDADFRRAELVSLPVTLAILLFAFGAVVAAGVPVLLGIAAVATALGLTALASRHLIPVHPNAQPMVLLIGLAVGVDYALFVLRRAREERARGYSATDSVVIATRHAGRAVMISGITVVVAMAGMLVAGGLFTSIAVGTVLVVTVAVLASATVLPAVLGLLGDRVEALRLPFRRRPTPAPPPPPPPPPAPDERDVTLHSSSERDVTLRSPGVSGFWAKLAGMVTQRPAVWSGVAAVALVALALPALGMRTALPGAESLPSSFATVDAYNRLSAAFPQDGTTVDVVVKTPASAAERVESALAQGFRTALRTGQVVGEAPEITASTDRTVHVLSLAVPLQESDPAMDDVVARVRAEVVPVITSNLNGVSAEVNVGGAAAGSDLAIWMTDRLVPVVAFVLVLTLLVMLVAFGSPALALATVGLNLLSVAAAYGVMTLVFQHTWAEGLFDFTSIGSIASWLPLVLFVILFGLSMDYHVFVVSRVREAYSAGATPREAVRLGVARSAGVVTSAAVVMVAVFAIFATLSSLEMKELGIGLASAILIDATVVRGVLLPGVLALLGQRAHTGPRWIPVLHH